MPGSSATGDIVLLAANDLGALLQVIAVILFVVIGLINKLMTGQGKPQQPKRRPSGRPVAPPPAGAEGKRGGRQELAAEIEEFLRRAAQKRGESAPAPREPVAPAPPQARRPMLVEQAHDVALEAPTSPAAPHESVAEHVRKHLSNPEFSRRAEHIADDVVRADQQMQDHVAKVFSHQLGRLADTSTVQTATVPSPEQSPVAPAAAGAPLAALLAGGQNIRNAIILNEILRRPADRW